MCSSEYTAKPIHTKCWMGLRCSASCKDCFHLLQSQTKRKRERSARGWGLLPILSPAERNTAKIQQYNLHLPEQPRSITLEQRRPGVHRNLDAFSSLSHFAWPLHLLELFQQVLSLVHAKRSLLGRRAVSVAAVQLGISTFWMVSMMRSNNTQTPCKIESGPGPIDVDGQNRELI